MHIIASPLRRVYACLRERSFVVVGLLRRNAKHQEAFGGIGTEVLQVAATSRLDKVNSSVAPALFLYFESLINLSFLN
jgi:protein gp37